MKKSFTILELLLVITIIMLLVALSLQAYANAKRSGRIAACKTYRKQVETFHYMPEYDFSTYSGKSPEDIKLLVETYNQCYNCHTTAGIPYYYAE